jgi:hypothetical protein
LGRRDKLAHLLLFFLYIPAFLKKNKIQPTSLLLPQREYLPFSILWLLRQKRIPSSDGSATHLFKSVGIGVESVFLGVNQPEWPTGGSRDSNMNGAVPGPKIEGSKVSPRNGILGSRRLRLSRSVEEVFPDRRFKNIYRPSFLCAWEVGTCNPRFYVLSTLIKFTKTKRGRRILPGSENMCSSCSSSLLISNLLMEIPAGDVEVVVGGYSRVTYKNQRTHCGLPQRSSSDAQVRWEREREREREWIQMNFSEPKKKT